MKLPEVVYIVTNYTHKELKEREVTFFGHPIQGFDPTNTLIALYSDETSLTLWKTHGWQGFQVTDEQLSVISLIPSYEGIVHYLASLGDTFDYPQHS